jgi:ribulose-phosphate 3-epimerase
MNISLSLWSMDQARLADEVARYAPLVDSFHVDVMDGAFADNLVFGPVAVETLRGLGRARIVVHLMVVEPLRWVDRFVEAGADELIVHPTACHDPAATVEAILAAGVRAGIAIGLDEPAEPALTSLPALSSVLVMGTPVGVKGHPFTEQALATVRTVTAARTPHANDLEVVVDGGIRWSSVPLIASAGADAVVAGSIVTSAEQPAEAIAAIAAARG